MRTHTITRTFVLTLAVTLTSQPLLAASPTKAARLAEKVRAGILKLGTGETAQVSLKLKDKTKRKGYVNEIGEHSFVLMETSAASATTIAYGDVAQVQGHNLSTRTKIIIGVSAVVAAIIVLYLVRGAFCDGC